MPSGRRSPEAEEDPPALVLEREMSCTPAEFLIALGRAVGGSWHGERFVVPVDEGRVDVVLTPGTPRRVGALALPVLHVRLAFNDVPPERSAAFIERLDLYSRRGGG